MIYCFDLDKTLCTYCFEKGLVGAKPLVERIKKVNKLYNEGHTILIDTARGSLTNIDHKKITELQLKRWGVRYHKLRCGVKFYADFYVDDKGINDGDFFK